MKRFVASFWAAFATIAVGVGLYLAAAAIDVLVWFWLSVGVALLYALVRIVLPAVARAWQRVRDYPRLLQASAQAEEDVRLTTAHLESAQRAAKGAYEKGVQEGRARVLGSLYAWGETPPELVGIGDFGGAVALLGKLAAPPIRQGARFRVASRNTGNTKGVVEIVHNDAAHGVVYLVCVEAAVPKFWDLLAERVEGDGWTPGVVLEPYRYDEDDGAEGVEGGAQDLEQLTLAKDDDGDEQ